MDWDELNARTAARQFPAWPIPPTVAEAVRALGPTQAQTARAPFIGLAARVPGLDRDAVIDAYESRTIVRGSTLRGTVHTVAATEHQVLDAVTRLGQRRLWLRLLGIDEEALERLWATTEDFAAQDWRTPEELYVHLLAWLAKQNPAQGNPFRGTEGRYLGFGHGGLIRRPASGGWDGQGAPVYATAARAVPGRPPLPGPQEAMAAAVLLHLRAHGPATLAGGRPTGRPPARIWPGGPGSPWGRSMARSSGSGMSSYARRGRVVISFWT